MTENDGKLTHLDEQGHARMVDVGSKAATARAAVFFSTSRGATIRRRAGPIARAPTARS